MPAMEHYQYPEKHIAKPIQICGELFYIGDDDVCSYLLNTGDGLLVIDTGYPTGQALEINSIYALGFSPENIKKILHTHGHFDHFGSTRLLKELSGAMTYLGWKDAKMFRENSRLALCEECGKYAAPELFVPDCELRDGDMITMGSISIRVCETPGHTEGTLSFFFDVHEDGKTYRVGIFGGVGRNTMRKAFYEKYQVSGYREMFSDSIDKMRCEDVDIALGTHTNQAFFMESYDKYLSGVKDNPFIDHTRWMQFVNETDGKLRQLLNDVSEKV